MKLTKVSLEDFEKILNRKDLRAVWQYSAHDLTLKGEIGYISHDRIGDNIERFVLCTNERDLIKEHTHRVEFSFGCDITECTCVRHSWMNVKPLYNKKLSS